MTTETNKKAKPIYKKWWFWAALIVVLISISGSSGNKGGSAAPGSTPTPVVSPTVSQELESKQAKVPIEYKSALTQATSYANVMHMSKKGVYSQLVSEYGGKFSPEAAQYGVDNVKADWNANALIKAKSYQDTMHQSPSAIRDQLVSEYGEKFTQSEADYAMQHLAD